MTGERSKYIALLLGAIGVVYGDIGTSPLYAIKSCFSLGHLALNEQNVFGLISVVCWSLFLIVSLKYVLLVLSVNNKGEGGILVLSSLCAKLFRVHHKALFIVFGVIGTALFFGDGVITPAISILGALEGLKIVSPTLSDHIIGISIVIIFGLFWIQRKGSGAIGAYFGPVILLWFVVLAVLGIYSIMQTPIIFKALNPYYAIEFFYRNGFSALLTLGAVILVVTGAEALYADLGHFGRKAISSSWNFLVFPSLLLNYLGQGALLIRSPEAIANPFYLLAPDYLLYPLLILATLATIIASQAVISGIASVSWQAIMLNYFPRLQVIHTSREQMGQVYVPIINYVICVLTISAVLTFQSSEKLAFAYGLSVSAIMLLTSIMVCMVAYKQWHWNLYKLLAVFVPIILLDLIFLGTNVMKLFAGAWYAIAVSVAVAYVVMVWMKGNKIASSQKILVHEDLVNYIYNHEARTRRRIPGTAVFMSRSPYAVPTALEIHLQHNKFLHEKVIFVSVLTGDEPYISPEDKYAGYKINSHTYSIVGTYGFKEIPDLYRIINWGVEQGIIIDKEENLSFFMSRGIPVPTGRTLKGFAKSLYMYLAKNSSTAYEFFRLPNNKVVELGIRYKI